MDAVEIMNLTKHYGTVKAVDDISFKVQKGSICGILGPNGSGKTTTIKSICNLIIPDKGNINIWGKDNKKSTNRISAVFEGTRNLYWRLTPRENLRYFAGIRGLGGKKVEKDINILMDRFNLTDKENVMVNNLSRGMQQKVAIATTLICNSDVILLDEPTLGLDVQSHSDIKNILMDITSDLDKTILLSTHDMNLVQAICNDVVVINKGKIVAKDNMKNLLNMFKTMTYEIVLTESITEENKKLLMELDYEFYIINNGSKIEVDILDFGDIYIIIERLKNINIFIKEIKQKNINFERVYLSLTDGKVD
ncbi:ABC transporter ATP-binding protein [Alkaliphilus sp. B6464]|uniref:ABC transporter ATP-binding protein n=1 Tax=Alkaliphilus sp. B6464 TaxID=2731219 RepID=UPI001BAA6E91|nr:ABC transporter ATP-binding protein [Alkaliphilus sp. B6464]QUH18663.1 ABC transporter ATP-binding protein [Alkaliphilus sp. B6464]